jgi:hypothetical protein
MRQGCMLSASRNTQSEAASATSSRTRLHSQRAHATVPRPSRQRSSAQLRLHGKSQAHSKSNSQSRWFTKPLHHTVPPFAPHDKPRTYSELRDIFVQVLPYSPPGCQKSRSTCSVPRRYSRILDLDLRDFSSRPNAVNASTSTGLCVPACAKANASTETVPVGVSVCMCSRCGRLSKFDGMRYPQAVAPRTQPDNEDLDT